MEKKINRKKANNNLMPISWSTLEGGGIIGYRSPDK